MKDGLPVYLVGPTGVGKTSVSLELAPRLNAEIVVADSMQVYRGLDIGTAKPTLKERQIVPHHMVDLIEPTQEFNVAQFVQWARVFLGEIQARSRVPLVVGGTGLYIKALIDGIFQGPVKDPQIRERLGEEARVSGWAALYERLKKVDPVAAGKIPFQNRRRWIRALEVYEMTGEPMSRFQQQWDSPQEKVSILGLERERGDLNMRIETRVDQMFRSGLVEEVEGLLLKGIEKNPVVMQAIGYKEVVAYLKGECSLEDAKSNMRLKTRQLAKRQMTWFRKDTRIRWFHLEPDERPLEVAHRIMEYLMKLK